MPIAQYLLFGGSSSERLVSVATAQHMARVLQGATCYFWRSDGSVSEVTHESLVQFERPFEEPFVGHEKRRFDSLGALVDSLPTEDGVFVLGLHGKGGEDGRLQEFFETKKIAFTASDSFASKNSFDKIRAKSMVASVGLKVAPSHTLTAESVGLIQEALQQWGPVVVKPAEDGSSEGLFFVKESESLSAAQTYVQGHPQTTFLVERQIRGRELTVGVWDSPEGLQALPATEVDLDPGRVFDFAGKYLGAGVRELTPAPIEDGLLAQLQEQALIAHRTLGAFGYSRTDFIWDGDDIYFLELNTLPGLTVASFIPQQLDAAGISMQSFLDQQVHLAWSRREGVAESSPSPNAS